MQSPAGAEQQPRAALDEALPAAQGDPSPPLSTAVVLKYRFQVVLGSPAPQRRGSTAEPKAGLLR